MDIDNTHYLDELHPLISYRFVMPIGEILERISGTPEAETLPETKREEREQKEG